MVEGKE